MLTFKDSREKEQHFRAKENEILFVVTTHKYSDNQGIYIFSDKSRVSLINEKKVCFKSKKKALKSKKKERKKETNTSHK